MLDKSYDGIIFDLDGTMWDTRKPICEAWNIILSRHEEIHRAPIVEADINDCMGLPMYDIAAKLFPQEQEQVRNALMDELCEFENGYLEKTGGVLFPELEATLKELRTKYPLYIVRMVILKVFLQHTLCPISSKILNVGEGHFCQRASLIRYL